MKKTTKIWLVIAVSLVLVGCILFGGVMAVINWDFTKLSTNKYEINEYEMDESFRDISIVSKTANVVLQPSENAKTSVVCYEPQNRKHTVQVKNNALVIEVVDTRKWYENIGVVFDCPQIVINLPKGEYGSLTMDSTTGNVEIAKEFVFENLAIEKSTGKINNYASVKNEMNLKTSTGDIQLGSLSAKMIKLSVTTGKIMGEDVQCSGDVQVSVSTGKTQLKNVTCKNFSSTGSTGKIDLLNVISKDTLSIKRSTGNVEFQNCDAGTINVHTSTGNVKGSLLTEKVFITATNTGDVKVPKTVAGGKCEITTDTGNIDITVK